MNCKICKQEAKEVFTIKIMGKYDVKYYQCSNCAFIQTEDPYWLDEAYSSAINYNDIGLISRNVLLSEEVTALLRLTGFDCGKKYLDQGGGYGLFVRMMRDNGFNFYWSDKYCENIYVKNFEADSLPQNEQHYEAVTAFEVFEHLNDPMAEIEQMLSLSDSILFSTELTNGSPEEIKIWWYIGADHGQHIALFNKKTLEFIARKLGLNLYSRKNLHLLTKKKVSSMAYNLAATYKLARLYNTLFPPQSLLQSDFDKGARK